MVDQQPIGRLLFEQWCEAQRPEYHRCLKFLDAAKRYEVETDEQKAELASAIRKEFLSSEGAENGAVAMPTEFKVAMSKIAENLPPQVAENGTGRSAPADVTVINVTDAKPTNGHCKELFTPCVQAVRSLLSAEPFREFTSSMYFHRYLQWKWLESQPVTYKTFRMYRVLGKGGFGEVCACQVRTNFN